MSENQEETMTAEVEDREPTLPGIPIDRDQEAGIIPRRPRGPGLLHLYMLLEDLVHVVLELESVADPAVETTVHQRLVDLLDETKPLTKRLHRNRFGG